MVQSPRQLQRLATSFQRELRGTRDPAGEALERKAAYTGVMAADEGHRAVPFGVIECQAFADVFQRGRELAAGDVRRPECVACLKPELGIARALREGEELFADLE